MNKNNDYNKSIKQIPSGQKKRSIINNLKSDNIYLDRNKIIKNYSIEISNSGLFINNNDNLYEKDSNINQSVNNINTNEKITENKSPVNDNNKNDIFIMQNSEDKEEDEQNNSFNENLATSLQSINDSKMLEYANQYIEEEKMVNKEKINEILNEKNSQRYFRFNK